MTASTADWPSSHTTPASPWSYCARWSHCCWPRRPATTARGWEDLIGALVAQQRDMLAALRLLQADVTAIARRVLDDPEHDGLNGRRAGSRPC